jgi:putative CocE/NonD family hydrolase
MIATGSFRLLDSVAVRMRDGTVLRTDIWLPGDEGSWPVLLQRTPYGKDDPFIAQHIANLNFRAALRRGYAVVVQDTRGRNLSDGDFDPFVSEGQDGIDTIAWLQDQSFCNGDVAMFGPSYVGATQVLAAIGNPPGLRAIAPLISTGRHDETWKYRSGAIEMGFLMLWTLEPLASIDVPRRLPNMAPEEAERIQSLYGELLADPVAAFARLPLRDAAFELLAPYAARWLDNARAQAAATDRDMLAAIAKSDSRVLVMCGWNDIFMEGSIELFEAARSRWNDGQDVPDRLLIGPWSHANLTDWQGEVWHGYAAFPALCEEQLDFFGTAFSGTAPATPVVRYFRTGSNSWREAPDWPIPGTERRSLYLSGTDQSLLSQPCEAEWRCAYVSDTLDPVPTTGGASFLPGLLHGRNSGPKDQGRVEKRDDVLLFTSAPLDRDLEVTGLVEANFWTSTSAPTCDWTVRLCEVDAENRSMGIVDGIHRWTPCNEDTAERTIRISVRLGHIGHLFQRGNRIRIQIASSNFPRFDRNPQSGVPSVRAEEADFRVAEQTVHGGPACPSEIILPIVPAATETRFLDQ